MSSDELTLAELWDYARFLRVMLPRDASLDEVRRLLAEKTKRLPKPTHDQVRMAEELGIHVDPTLYIRSYANKLIESGLKRAGEAILNANKALDDGNVIMYNGVPHKILRIAFKQGSWMVSLRCLVGGKALPDTRLNRIADAKLATPEDLENL